MTDAKGTQPTPRRDGQLHGKTPAFARQRKRDWNRMASMAPLMAQIEHSIANRKHYPRNTSRMGRETAPPMALAVTHMGTPLH